MSVIVPRWEWRAFGEDFGAAEGRFAGLTPEGVEGSDELYVLSLQGGDTVKVRDGLMDVKRLQVVNDEGLERWAPVMKAEFPLAAEDVGLVLTGLLVELPRLARTVYTLDELIDEVVRPSNELVAVRVHKRRQRYTLGGCMAELTKVGTDRGGTRTIAVESEDPCRVMATVRELGLGSLQNVNFPRGLKALVGFGAPRYAVIDVGTNSIKLHIGERHADGVWEKVIDRSEITRLGEGLAEIGRLAPGPMHRTLEAIAAMAGEARQEGAVAIAAVGTAALRIAANRAAFVAAVEARCGVRIEVISGDEEGRLAYLAVKSGLGLSQGTLVVFDTGGGSSQFTFGHGDYVDERLSLNVGAARFVERFSLDRPVTEDTLSIALDAIESELAPLDGRPAPDTLVAMGGAATNLAAVKHQLTTYDPDVVQGTVLDLPEIDRQIAIYCTRTMEERRRIIGLQANRAEVILGGACIVRTIMTKLGRQSLTVSDRGLRHGLLVERFGQ